MHIREKTEISGKRKSCQAKFSLFNTESNRGSSDYMKKGKPTLTPFNEAFPKAKAAAMRALEIDDTLAEAHACLGGVRVYYDWDWPGAASELKRAIELSPNCASAHELYALHLELMGRLDEAMAEVERARELDPLSPAVCMDVGIRHYCARRYDNAIKQYLEVLEMTPAFPLVHYFLWMAYERKGMYDEALAQYQKMMSLSGHQECGAALAEINARQGYRAVMQEQLKSIRELSARRFSLRWDVAAIYALLGEIDQAFDWLEKAYQDRISVLPWTKIEPRFDPLRSDPRYQALLRKMNFRG